MSGLGGTTLARVKPGPKPDPERVRSSNTNLRSRPEWKAWLEEVASSKGLTAAEVIDRALLLWARDEGLTMPPKR